MMNKLFQKVPSRGSAETTLECNDDDPKGEVAFLGSTKARKVHRRFLKESWMCDGR